MNDSHLPQPPTLPDSAAEPMPALAEQIVELSALTGGLAHEIRNPLSTLKVNLQLLDEDWRLVESPEAGRPCDPRDVARRSRKRIATLVEQSNHLERILQDFLQYVGKRELKRAPCDLNALVGNLVDFYKPQAEAQGIELRLSLPERSLVCDIDADLMKQVLLNLLLNAQQAMPDGGEVHLQVGVHSDTVARIDVIDTGPGIPEDRQEQVFHAYYSTKKGGTGLGLATTRQIVREHGGRVHVYSKPPHGSCFTILLPTVERA
jgi:signal transduction histidine kinase